MKTLLIDDIRNTDYIKVAYGIEVTHIARNFAAGINALKFEGPFDLLLLDHDLASFDEEGNELTGNTIMLFLEEHPEYLPKDIILVTANPVGRVNMQRIVNKLYNK